MIACSGVVVGYIYMLMIACSGVVVGVALVLA